MAGLIVHMASAHRAGDPRIFQKECRTLAAAGYDVRFIVPHDRDEVQHGVQLLAVPQPRNGKERLTSTLWHIARRAAQQPADAVFHIHDAELLIVGWWLRLRGRTVVYDAHEDTPQQAVYHHWLPRWLRPVWGEGFGLLERLAGTYFAGIVAAEPLNAQRFDTANTVVVHNYPLVDELRVPDPTPYTLRPNRIAYVGGLSQVRGLREMMAAVAALPDALAPDLLLGGPFFPATLADDVSAWPGAERTAFPGYLTRAHMADVLDTARVGIVVLQPVQKYVEAYPTKLFEYMAVGLPVVASHFPGWKAIIGEAGCGLTVDPTDVGAIADALRWLLEHPEEAQAMGERGRHAVETRYNWANEARTLLDFYRTRLPLGEGR